MSKPKHPRGLADFEAQAITHNIRVSPMKLNLVAAMIRGAKAQDAVATLTFSKRRIAQTVKKTLESAIANAENWRFRDCKIDTLDGKGPKVTDSTGVTGLRPRVA